MPKSRSRKPIAHDGGQGSKTAGDAQNEIALGQIRSAAEEAASAEREDPFAQGEGAEAEMSGSVS